MAYVPDRGEIYVAIYNAAKVSVISDKTNTVIKELSLGVYGGNPGGAIYDPYKGQIWVPAGDTLIFSEKDYSIIGQVPMSGSMAYDSVTHEMFIANGGGNTVTIFSDGFVPSATNPPTNQPTAPSTQTQQSSPKVTPSSVTNPNPAGSNPNPSGNTGPHYTFWLIVIVILILCLLIIRRRRKASRTKKNMKLL
jgi:DNA-binding beta-propeller fold protein YncE